MKIAIVGAGFTGLATAWYVLQQSQACEVTIYDEKVIGGGTSGIAAGLLHYYAGAHAKLNRFGKEGWQETNYLLEIASQALGKPVAEYKGMLRLALTDAQVEDFSVSAAHHSDLSLWDTETCQQKIPYVNARVGLFIPSAIAVFSNLYLAGLWEACRLKGARFIQQQIAELAELAHFDHIIIATGEGSGSLIDLNQFNLNRVKGQLLELQWPPELAPLPFPLNSHVYLMMSPSQQTCIVGSTFEREFTDLQSDLTKAKNEILPKVYEFFSLLRDMPVVNAFSGGRLSTKNHLPLCKQINAQTWLLTGMGSKGLLYHALFAKKLVSNIFE